MTSRSAAPPPSHSHPAAEPGRWRRNRPDWVVLALLCTGQFMVVLDVSIVNVALPSIRTDLGFSESGLQWVVNAYTVAFAGFMLLGGRAGDLFGHRRVLLAGLALFTVASLAGGLAQHQAVLVAARVAQGLGGAILAPATLTILTTTFPEGPRRARAVGAWAAVGGAGGASGALLGGVLTEVLGWRWILFVNVPIGVVTLVAAWMLLTETGRTVRGPLDVAGAVLVTGGLMAAVYGIVSGAEAGWRAAPTVVPLAAGTLLLVAFVLHEGFVARAPLLPLRLFRSRGLATADLAMLLIGAAIFPSWYFLSLYMQNVLDFSPLQTGLAFVPQTLGVIIGAQVGSRLVSRIEPRSLLVVGALLSTTGLVWLATIPPDGTYLADLLVPGVLLTAGTGLGFPSLALTATGGVHPSEAGLASALLTTGRQVGGSLGLAALATVAASRAAALSTGAGEPTAAALTSGYGRSFGLAAGLTAAAAALAVTMPKRVPVDRPARAAGEPGGPAGGGSALPEPGRP